MSQYLTGSNIQNFSYSIHVLKSKHSLSDKEKSKLNEAYKVIQYAKYSSRLYLGMEMIRLIYLKKTKGKFLNYFAYSYIRILGLWLTSNVAVNYYLINNTELNRMINKHKEMKSQGEFSQYIQHR